jgi:hypothetical protein
VDELQKAPPAGHPARRSLRQGLRPAALA